MIEYRLAHPQDAKKMAYVRKEMLSAINSIDDKSVLKAMEQANCEYLSEGFENGSFAAWLAFDGDKLVGTSGITFFRVPPSISCKNGKQGYIMNMYTIPEYRGQGIASELLSRIKVTAREHDCQKLTLFATDMGKPLYEKLGFIEVNGDMEYHLHP